LAPQNVAGMLDLSFVKKWQMANGADLAPAPILIFTF
jgi:hypothetical protein